MVKISESAIKIVNGNKPKRLSGLSQNGVGSGMAVSLLRHRGPHASRSIAGT